MQNKTEFFNIIHFWNIIQSKMFMIEANFKLLQRLINDQ